MAMTQASPVAKNESLDKSALPPGWSHLLSHWATAWMILLCVLATTAGGWYVADNSVHRVARAHFDAHVESLQTAIYRRMTQQVDALRGGVGLFGALETVDRKQWRSYVDQLRIEENYPGLQGFGFSQVIRPADKAAHIRRVQAEGFPDYDIKPPGERNIYTSIVYLEPFSGRNLRAFGFDMFSEPTRRAAMEYAQYTGEAGISGIVTLVQETDQNVQRGFLMYLPVYRGGRTPWTVEDRRDALIGYVYSPFRVNDLMAGILGGTPDVNFQIYDGSAIAPDALLYRGGDRDDAAALHYNPEFTHTAVLAFGGRSWTLHFQSHQGYISPVERGQPFVVAAAGTLIAILLFFIIRSISTQHQRAERLAQWMTEELQAATVRTRAIVDTVVDGLITIDERGRIETVNPAVERIFGYSAAEVVGQNVNMLMPEPYRSEHDDYLKRFLNGGSARIIGRGREVSGKRKDGSVFPMDLAVNEMKLGYERRFVGTVRDISERKQIERLKNEFVSVVSHELRTPLTSIRGSLGLVASGVAGEIPSKAGDLIRIAYKNSERLTNLINDILDIEKIESGKMQFKLSQQNVVTLLEQAIEANQGYARGLNVELEFVVGAPDIQVRTDTDRFMQVMANLLSNAVKFSPPEGKVEVSVAVRDGAARVSVRDHGSGIPPEFQGRIFKKFSQADSSETRAKGGTGLGLSICKTIVEHMGGAIGFESGSGQGTVFHVDLPLYVEAPVVIDAGSSGSEARVLICEDDPGTARLIQVMINEGGLRADIAPDAAAARRLLRERTYAALTLDLALPDCDGIAFIRELRADPATHGLPIVVVSVSVENGQPQIYGGFGVLDWLSKPIDQHRLMAALHRGLRGQEHQKPRVLHVEDDPDIGRVVISIAGNIADFDVVGSLQEARARLRANHYQLILLDVSLPDGAGWELLDSLKGMDDPPPILVFSASDVGAVESRRVAASLVKSRTSNEELVAMLKKLLGVTPMPPARAA